MLADYWSLEYFRLPTKDNNCPNNNTLPMISLYWHTYFCDQSSYDFDKPYRHLYILSLHTSVVILHQQFHNETKKKL